MWILNNACLPLLDYAYAQMLPFLLWRNERISPVRLQYITHLNSVIWFDLGILHPCLPITNAFLLSLVPFALYVIRNSLFDRV